MAKNEIKKIIKNNRIISDYHPGINVIGFLLGVVHAWKSIKNRKVDYSEIDELENRIQETKKHIIRRHFIGTAVVESVNRRDIGLIEKYLNEKKDLRWAGRYLKMIVDFGDNNEIMKISNLLPSIKKHYPDLIDDLFVESYLYASQRFSHDDRYRLLDILDMI